MRYCMYFNLISTRICIVFYFISFFIIVFNLFYCTLLLMFYVCVYDCVVLCCVADCNKWQNSIKSILNGAVGKLRDLQDERRGRR